MTRWIPGAAVRPEVPVTAFAICCLAYGSPVLSQPSSQLPVTVVIGTVNDTAGKAISSARVSVAGHSAAVLSGTDGRFAIGAVQRGEHTLETRALGFAPERALLTLAGNNDTLRVEIVLTSLPQIAVILPAAQIVDRATPFDITTGFSDRRRRGNGVFFDRESIERRRPVSLTDMLRGVPGLTLRPVTERFGQSYSVGMDRVPASGGKACQINYFVNGNEYTPSAGGIDHEFPPDQVEAIEVYRPSETPAQYSGSRARCGAILIWTRVRAHELSR